MSNEQESMPKMQASQEDMAMRKKQLQQRRLAAQRAAKVNSAAAPVAAPAAKQTLAIAALILTIVMAGFAGFLFIQLQEADAQLKKAEGILNGHATNLAALNDKLSASDENANLSVDALKILLKNNSKEIRKLWDLTNKTNKPNIAKNNKAISGVKASIANVDKKAASVDSKVANANSAIDGNKKKIGSNKNSISDLKASIALYQNAMDDKLAQLKSSVNGLPAATEKRINDNEQSIRSIDATRKKLNSSMAEVESQFNEMKLEIEDIQIRLDRMQNAITGTL